MAAQHAAATEGTMSRFKSFKKSLRDSFRRRRRPRSPQNADGSPKNEAPASPPTEGGETAAAASSDDGKKTSPAKSPLQKRELPIAVHMDDEAETIERAVEARSEKTDTLNSMIRAAVFAKTYLVNCK